MRHLGAEAADFVWGGRVRGSTLWWARPAAPKSSAELGTAGHCGARAAVGTRRQGKLLLLRQCLVLGGGGDPDKH